MSQRIINLAILTSIAGLLILTYASEALEPPKTRIKDIDTGLMGKNIHTEGIINSIHTFKGGSILITLSEENHSIDVFIPYSVAKEQPTFKPQEKQEIDVIGTVEIYNGGLELAIQKRSNIREKSLNEEKEHQRLNAKGA